MEEADAGEERQDEVGEGNNQHGSTDLTRPHAMEREAESDMGDQVENVMEEEGNNNEHAVGPQHGEHDQGQAEQRWERPEGRPGGLDQGEARQQDDRSE